MKVGKESIKESSRLVEAIKAAGGVNHDEEIQQIEEEILKEEEVYQRHKTLRHHFQMAEARNRKDRLFGGIEFLRAGKCHSIEASITAYDKFHRPYHGEFSERIEDFYLRLEKEKNYTSLGKTDSNFILSCYLIRSNILSVLEGQKILSAEFNWFRTTRTPLAEWVSRFDALEKSVNLFDFPQIDLKIFGDPEVAEFRLLFLSKRDLERSDFRIAVLSEEVLNNHIAAIRELQKPKKISFGQLSADG